MSLFTKKAYVGLDIGHHTLRAVQVERTAIGWRIAKSASAPTPDDTVRDGVVIDAPLLGLAIKNLLKGAHIHATSASIAISGGTVVVRPIRLPKMAESALRKSIRFEASRYVPNSVEDSYIEFEIVGDVDATNMDVIIAAAPKELVDSRVDACQQAGLEVEHVEVATFAAYRSIVEADHGHEWADKTIGLVDIGSSVTNIGVVSNGGFSMTRAIPAGGQVLTDALKSYFKLSTEDAESGKSQLDIRGLLNEASVAENPPLRILHTHVDDLVREVRRSINYWQSQQNEASNAKHVDVIVLCGGGSNMPGLPEYFQHKLAVETVAVGVFDNARFIPSHPDAGRGLDMAVAVGLAMGLAPSQGIVREPKQVAAKVPKAMKPPREPKPSKPTKGRTFKVSIPVEDAPGHESVGGSTEGVEIAAAMPPAPPLDPATPESAPLVAKVHNADIDEPAREAKFDVSPVAASETENFVPIVAEAHKVEANVEEKYGPELAALIGAFEGEPPIATFEAANETGAHDDIVQPLSASQRMASRGTSAAASTAAYDHEAEKLDTVANVESAPVQPAPAMNPAPAITPQPQIAIPAAFAPDPSAVRSALLGDSFDSEIGGPVNTTRAEKPRKSLFSMGAKTPPPVASPEADALFVSKLKAQSHPTPVEAGKPVEATKEAKPKKPLFARAPKPEKAVKPSAAEPQTATTLKKAAAWLFGGPKQHVKPSGILKPKSALSAAEVNALTAAFRDPEIELLRGSSLEPVDTTLTEATSQASALPSEPKAVADVDAPKAKARKTPPAKKPRTPDSETDSKKEAA